MIKVNLEEGLSRFDELWRPKIVADLNDYKVQLVKVQGEWVWHKHDETDEFFLVIVWSIDDADARRRCGARARGTVGRAKECRA